MECMRKIEYEIWDGMKGRVVWYGMDEKSKGRERKGRHS